MIMLKNLWNKISRFVIPAGIGAAVIVRIYGSLRFPAQYYDIGTYEAWGRLMTDYGPANFFKTQWSDYLPLPIYLCSLILYFAKMFHATYGVVFKLTVSFIELVLLGAIARVSRSPRLLLVLPLLALSPALIGDSAFWGQLDTIPALAAVLSLLLLLPNSKKSDGGVGRLILSAVMFGLAVAFKPIMFIILPVLIIVLVQNYSFFKFFLFGAISFILFLSPAIPVGGNPVQFLYEKSVEQASTYPNTTINGWNIWSVTDLHNQWPPDKTVVFNVSAHTLGLILFFVLAFVVCIQWKREKWDKKFAVRVAGTLLILFYVFTTRMHERHLLFGLPFLAVAALAEPALIIPTAILTLSFTLNLWGAYYWVNHSQSWPVTPDIISLVSWINVLTGLWLGLVWNGKEVIVRVRAWLQANKVFFLILCLAAFLRVYNLSYPKEYIFDEVYHSFTAREFLHNNIAAWEWWTTPPKGVAYEWTHPPLAKYGMVTGMLLFGENSFGWRIGSAVMGIISIAGIYYLTYAVLKNKSTALLAAFLVSIEGLHVSQSRIGMNDMYMLCFLIWSLYNAVKGRWKSAAILFGLSLASKWSALYGVVPLGFIYLHDNPPQAKWLSLITYPLSVIRILLISVIVYVLSFTPFLTAGHTWAQWWELHRQMWYYHTHLVATHAYQSTPWQWVLSLRPVWYYVHYGTDVSNIYAQGNPAILWFGLVALIIMIPFVLRFGYTLLFLAYAVFTVPWIFSPRIMFFYHYLPSATFLCVVLATWLATLSKKSQLLFLLLFSLVFIFMSPVYFGFPMAKGYWDTLFGIFPSWK